MIRVNLLPPEMRGRQLAFRRVFTLIASAVFLLLFLLYAYDYMELRSLEQKQRQAQESHALLKRSEQRQAEIEQKRQKIAAKNAILVELSKSNTSWHAVLIHISDLIPDNIWLREISLNEKRELIIKGNAIHYQDLAAFLQKFEQNALLKDAALITSSSAKEESTQVESIAFEISAQFRER